MKNKKIIYLVIMIIIASLFSGCQKTKDIYKDVDSEYVTKVWVEDEKTPSSDSGIVDDNLISEENNMTSSATVNSTSTHSDTTHSDVTSSVSSVPSKPISNKYTVCPEDFMKDYSIPYFLEKFESKFDKDADVIRNKVLSAKDNIKVSGKIWYVSSKGDDGNDGTTSSKAWATTSALTKYENKIKSGDAVLFERGSVFRGGFKAISGVYYGAYGKGAKPCFYGSYKADKSKWVDTGNNIWRYDGQGFVTDVGQVILNHGKALGTKKENMNLLSKNYDFYVNFSKLHMYSKKNPAKLFSSIEIATDGTLISVPAGAKNVTIDNLTIKYSGGHGLQTAGSVKNVHIKNCEFGYIGGCILSGYGDGTTPYGNAVEFWNGCEGSSVKNCWIYQVFDSGITHQGDGKYRVKNLTLSGNLIEYCGFGSIEYWHNVKTLNSMENVLYENNVLRFAGYGIGGKRSGLGCHIHSNTNNNDNYAKNFVIRNNIFDIAFDKLLAIYSRADTFPEFTGNTYSQANGKKLATYTSAEYIFDEKLTEIPFDLSGKIFHYSEN